MSLYTDLVEAGVEISNRYSDLYFPANAQTQEIVKRHPKAVVRAFKNQITKTVWYEAPFQYDPYWEVRMA